MRKAEAIYSELLQQWSHCHLHLAETQGQAEEWESFTVEGSEGLRYATVGGCRHEETVGGPTRSRASYAVGRGAYLTFAGWC